VRSLSRPGVPVTAKGGPPRRDGVLLWVLAIAALTVVPLGLLAFGLARGERTRAPVGREGEREKIIVCSDAEMGSVASVSPGGDWWGKSADGLVFVRLDQGHGFAGVRWHDVERVYPIRISWPGEGLLDPRLIQYDVGDEEAASTWYGSIPGLASYRPGVPFKHEGDPPSVMAFDRMEGPVRVALPLDLCLLARHDPRETCSALELEALERLEAAVAEAGRRER